MKLKGPLLLLTTAFLWGMGFVAQTSAAQAVEPFTFNAARNFAGAAFLALLVAWRMRFGRDTPPSSDASGYSTRTLVIASIACGTLLFAAGFFQQWGITAYPPEAAASSRSGFLTTTYVVMVAFIAFFLGKRPSPIVIFSIVLTVVGMYLLCVPDGFGSIYLGDWLVLICAVIYSFHIILIDRYTHIDAVRLSTLQLLVAAILSTIFAFIFENPSLAPIITALIPILYTGIVSNGIAFTLQIVGQKTTPPATASIIMTLEGVFAALGGWIILSERLSPIEILGCALVFIAAIISQIPNFTRNELTGTASAHTQSA
ncbi:MAG: DMT family transporter [Actinomycetaceae bacterium]|nr:DMT family transporter [Actinomycetaceae bacterium]